MNEVNEKMPAAGETRGRARDDDVEDVGRAFLGGERRESARGGEVARSRSFDGVVRARTLRTTTTEVDDGGPSD